MTAIVAPTTHNIQLASDLLQQGKLVALPTETVYGLAADASQPEAIKQVFSVKQRPQRHPLILHLHSSQQIDQWACEVPNLAYQLIEQFWPGPLTLILPKHPQVSSLVTGGMNTIAIRIPDQPVTREVLQRHNLAVVAPSANLHCQISPTQAQHVEPLRNQIGLILDGGACPVGVESTILDLTQTPPALRRLGATTLHQLEGLVNHIDTTPLDDFSHATPGNLPKHYSPQTPCYLLNSAQLSSYIKHLKTTADIAVITLQNQPDDWQGWWHTMPDEAQAYAQRLYAALHQADRYNARVILVEKPSFQNSLGLAIQDRLQKACYTTQ